MNRKAIFSAGLALALASCASVPPNSINYAAYAGDPIPLLKFNQILYNWHRIDDTSLVVWTQPGESYLLTLRFACSALRTVHAVGVGAVDGMEGRMIAGDTDLIAGTMRCRIETIRPIDEKKLDGAQKG
jgi:hypothetical protein